MADEPDPDEVLDLLGDEYVRTMLRASSRDPRSAKELSEAADSALSTIYRRAEDLEEARMLLERTEIEADGSHHSVFEPGFAELRLRLEDGEFDLEMERIRDSAHRFATMWEDMREV